MVYNLVTREQWDARPPTRIVPLNLAKVDKFIVHYSGASRTQTVRSIQNYCMDTKGHSDIDYSYLVRDLDLYIGRGVNEGSHTLDNNATSFGVCVIGNDGDATDADFAVVRTLYDELCVKVGRTLRYMGHNQAPGLPPGYTSCPGSEIQAWINEGMPNPMADSGYTQGDRDTATADTFRLATLLANGDAAVYRVSWDGGQIDHVEPNLLKEQLNRIEALVAAATGGGGTGITEDELRQIIREEIAKTRLS